ncbi:hypothetical protein AB6D11_06140 [Vibrio splendidus]
MSHYLTKKQIKEVRDLVSTRIETLVASINQRNKQFEDTERCADAIDASSQKQDRDNIEALINRERSQLVKLRRVEDISDAELGYCLNDDCGTEDMAIGFLRIKFDPTIQYCLDCKEVIDKKG